MGKRIKKLNLKALAIQDENGITFHPVFKYLVLLHLARMGAWKPPNACDIQLAVHFCGLFYSIGLEKQSLITLKAVSTLSLVKLRK